MTNRTTNHKTEGLAAILDFYQVLSIDSLQHSGLHAFVTGIDSAFLNVVIDTREESATLSSKTITSIKDFFKKYNSPWCWFVTSDAKTNELLNADFSLLETAPGMYLNLESSLPDINLSSISIKEADKNNDLIAWTEAIAEGFPSDDNAEKFRLLNMNLLNNGQRKLRHFIAYENSNVAAAATLFLSDHSVILHNLATKNKYRNKRIGTLLTIHLLKEAQKMGYKYCYLDSSEEGLSLYTKLGFQNYCITNAMQPVE